MLLVSTAQIDKIQFELPQQPQHQSTESKFYNLKILEFRIFLLLVDILIKLFLSFWLINEQEI